MALNGLPQFSSSEWSSQSNFWLHISSESIHFLSERHMKSVSFAHSSKDATFWQTSETIAIHNSLLFRFIVISLIQKLKYNGKKSQMNKILFEIDLWWASNMPYMNEWTSAGQTLRLCFPFFLMLQIDYIHRSNTPKKTNNVLCRSNEIPFI